jgi:hypothetical protein
MACWLAGSEQKVRGILFVASQLAVPLVHNFWSSQLHVLTCHFCHVCSGGKLGLSMRDVDQATGRDLLDLEKIRAAQVSPLKHRSILAPSAKPCIKGAAHYAGHAIAARCRAACRMLSLPRHGVLYVDLAVMLITGY